MVIVFEVCAVESAAPYNVGEGELVRLVSVIGVCETVSSVGSTRTIGTAWNLRR
jgi:hypothetical protein